MTEAGNIARREQYIESALERIADLEAERDRLRGVLYRMSEEMRREINVDGQLRRDANAGRN